MCGRTEEGSGKLFRMVCVAAERLRRIFAATYKINYKINRCPSSTAKHGEGIQTCPTRGDESFENGAGQFLASYEVSLKHHENQPNRNHHHHPVSAGMKFMVWLLHSVIALEFLMGEGLEAGS